jgi:hypothetical protein
MSQHPHRDRTQRTYTNVGSLCRLLVTSNTVAIDRHLCRSTPPSATQGQVPRRTRIIRSSIIYLGIHDLFKSHL